MAATIFNRSWDSLLTTTLDNYRPTMIDQIIKGTALTYWLTTRGKGQGLRYDVGGQFLQIPVVYNKNSNFQTISGYDRINLAPTDEATSAFERWANCVSSVGISLDEAQANKGMSRRANLLRMKVDVMETSAREDWERRLVVGTPSGTKFIAGNGGKDPVPLGHLVQKVATDASSVHNIPQATEAWWRNQNRISTSQGGTITWAVFLSELLNIQNLCRRGSTNDGPDFALATQEAHELIENGMISRQRSGFYSDSETNSLGFGGIQFRGMTIMWSEIMGGFGVDAAAATTAAPTATTAHIFLLNSRWLELVVDEEWDWKLGDFEKPIDQYAAWASMLWRGNLTVLQRRKQGLFYAINPANVTIPA